MELVVNTNRIIAALIKDSESRKIIYSAKFSLYTTAFSIKEVEKYKEYILKKAKISENEFNQIMEIILSKIAVYGEYDISKKSMKKAITAMKEIDPDDVPLLALAIELKKDIWSDDKHFQKQKTAKVWKTKDLVKKL